MMYSSFFLSLAQNKDIVMFVKFRFLSKLFTQSFLLGSSIIDELFRKEECGTATVFAIALPMVRPFAAPVASGFISESKELPGMM